MNTPTPPDLQEWVRRAGGYRNIDWLAWDAAVAAWREKYREHLEREKMEAKQP
jgi:hypothetical protein